MKIISTTIMRPELYARLTNVTNKDDDGAPLSNDGYIELPRSEKQLVLAGLDDLSNEKSLKTIDVLPIDDQQMVVLVRLIAKLSGTSYKEGDALGYYNTIQKLSPESLESLKEAILSTDSTKEIKAAYRSVRDADKPDNEKADSDTDTKAVPDTTEDVKEERKKKVTEKKLNTVNDHTKQATIENKPADSGTPDPLATIRQNTLETLNEIRTAIQQIKDQTVAAEYTRQVDELTNRINTATDMATIATITTELTTLSTNIQNAIANPNPTQSADTDGTDTDTDGNEVEGAPHIVIDEDKLDDTMKEERKEDTSPTEPQSQDQLPVNPEPVDNRTKYKQVYDLVDKYAMSPEQAELAKRGVDVVLDDPATFATEYKALTGKPGPVQNKCIFGILTHMDPKLGFRDPTKSSSDTTSQFGKGTVMQSRDGVSAKNALVMPTGFGQKKSTVPWNTPVITDFGFPFLNFSSEAMLHIIKSTEADENIKNANLKAMFKDAAKNLGGIWKAIYASPLALLRQIATELGTKCTPNYIKIDGNDLIESEAGDSVTVYPVKYYSVEPEYEPAVSVPRDFLTSFYEVMDYSASSRKTYLKYAYGMTADDFAEETDENGGIPPFYILVPKSGKFSKCEINPGSLFGSLLNLVLGRKKCTMVKTMFMGKRGCLAMESDVANKLYADT
jgi:hypothetical protein